MQSPRIAPIIVIADDEKLAARASCLLAQPGTYLSVVDGPRLGRPDAPAEATRRNNAAARAKAKKVLFVGLSQVSIESFDKHFGNVEKVTVTSESDLSKLLCDSPIGQRPPLHWGRDCIAVGALKAMRASRSIVFTDEPSPREVVPSESGHLVVYEEGEALSDVIAANYAFALGAGLQAIPEVPKATCNALLEELYSLHDSTSHLSVTDRLLDIQARLRKLCDGVDISACTSVTFISRSLPFGFAFSETPSTHLFSYPDLGIAVVNGLAAEQANTHGVDVALLVDPHTTDAPEIEAAGKALAKRDAFVRAHRGKYADVTSVEQAMKHFPYDLLLFATHCGDASGHRWTYEFQDSEGHSRTLVVDIALGVGRTRDADILKVQQYIRFHSLDGVDWNDPDKASKVYVGKSIIDWSIRFRADDLKPTKKEHIDRVYGSAVLRMNDNNYVVLPQYLAGRGTPIIIVNACASWRDLAARLMFENARAYVGTLFPVMTSEAHDVALGFLDRHYGKPLADALWLTQNDVYGTDVRRPYVLSGVYPQALRASSEDPLERIARGLLRFRHEWMLSLERYRLEGNEFAAKTAQETVEYYQGEIAALKKYIDQHILPRSKP